MTTYINDKPVTFNGTTMVFGYAHSKQVSALKPGCHPGGRWLYTMTYNPTSGTAINNIPTSEITWTPELLSFVKEMTAGKSFAKIYDAALADWKKSQRIRHIENRSIHTCNDTDEVMRERF